MLYLTPTDPSGRKCQRSPRRALHPVVARSIRLESIECTAAFLHCPFDRTPPIPAEHGQVEEYFEGDGTVDGPDPRRLADQNWVAPGCLKSRCSRIFLTCQGADPWRTTSEPHIPSTCLQQPEGTYPGCFGPSHFRNDDPKNRTMHPRRVRPTYLTSLRTPDSPSPRRPGERILLHSRRDAIPWRIGHSILDGQIDARGLCFVGGLGMVEYSSSGWLDWEHRSLPTTKKVCPHARRREARQNLRDLQQTFMRSPRWYRTHPLNPGSGTAKP